MRQISTVGLLQDRLRTAFPELGQTAWGLTTVRSGDGDTFGLEYLLVPTWFAETFAMDRQNARSWERQKAQLLETDSLRIVVAVLQDSVIRLEPANGEAYRTGCRSAFAGYQELNRLYVAELRKPQFRVLTAIGLIGAAGIGLVVRRALP